MRIHKHKKFQKSVEFYIKHFNLKPPFSLLVDGTFAKAALDNKVNLREQLPKYFDSAVKLYTTYCCLDETEKLGPELYGALQVLKTLILHKCPHAETPGPAAKCIRVLAKGKRREQKQDGSGERDRDEKLKFIPATQDLTLRRELRGFAGIPILYLHGHSPVFEKPSTTTKECARGKEMKKMEVLDYQKEILDKMKQDAFGNIPQPERKGTKKRKRAGPNPLSCKKSKKASTAPATATGPSDPKITSTITKKKRKRIRVPKHVKEELAKMKKSQDN